MPTAQSDPTPLAADVSDCCVAGFLHAGAPTGSTTQIAGFPTYIASPAPSESANRDAARKVILFLADIYGPQHLNNQLIQDFFATKGFEVLGPDYFLGDPIQNHTDEPGFDRPAWIAKSRAQVDAHFPAWLDAVKQRYSTTETKYFAVGYCFGAPYTVQLGAAGSFLSAAAFAHPAFLSEADIAVVRTPLLMSCAEKDFLFTADARRRAEDILAENGVQFHVQVFSGMEHGFAAKGDARDPDVRWAKEESARGVVVWFDKYAA